MKKVNLLNVVMITFILFSCSTMYGQNRNDSSLKLFGLGLHMEQFRLNDLNLNFIPANKIIFTINPNNNWRIEPEIGFNNINNKDAELKDKSLSLGIGVLGMYQRGRANIYAGLRFEYSDISHEYLSGFGKKQTEKLVGLAIGPVVGVEFFFGHNFSIGGEVALKYINLKAKDSQYDDDAEQVTITTETGLLLRFYF